MPLLAIPNVSEGRDKALIERATAAIATHARVLDVHSDRIHNRSVFTVTANAAELQAAMVALARVATTIDLTTHTGVHPRLGVFDVCPFVPHETAMEDAIRAARGTAEAMATEVKIPVYLYGLAARENGPRELPHLRRGGLAGVADRGIRPDFGPPEVDPRVGVVCVGARDVLIAFNVWLRTDLEATRRIAAAVRTSSGGLEGIRALALDLGNGMTQVSMNLIAPAHTGIDETYEIVVAEARAEQVEVVATEIVGLVPQRFAPDPKREAARLLIQPGRTLESTLESD